MSTNHLLRPGLSGRALHLIDAENLAGTRSRRPLPGGLGDLYRTVVRPGPFDHLVVASDVTRVFDCGREFPGARVRAGRGPDGADRTLTDAVDWALLPDRFTCLVIGSGDGHFAMTARRATAAGLVVVVVSRRGSLSGALARQADGLVVFPACFGPVDAVADGDDPDDGPAAALRGAA